MASAVSQTLDQENGPVLFLSDFTILKDDNIYLSISFNIGMSLETFTAQLNNFPLHSEI